MARSEAPSRRSGPRRAAIWAGGLVIALGIGLGIAGAVEAQFGPPATIFGSISDSEGEIPEGLEVHAFIGDTLCSDARPEHFAKTIHTGEGDARVAVYVINVAGADQEEGCGTDGAEIRIEVDGRLADQIAVWRRGPAQLNITFGDATPAPIPTFTPTATATSTPTPDPDATATATPTRRPGAATALPSEDGTPEATVADGTVTAGGQGGDSGSDTPESDGTPEDGDNVPASADDGEGEEPTLEGGVTTGRATTAEGDDDGGGGFPVWPVVLVAVGILAVLGGGVGYMMSRASGGPLPPGDSA